jgi:hypothetical protein
MTQHTKDFLADELDKAGLHEMAAKARTGYYHDYLSELDAPEIQLDLDLVDAVIAGNRNAGALRDRHHNGEFDANAKESEEWANSPAGQEAMSALVERPRG